MKGLPILLLGCGVVHLLVAFAMAGASVVIAAIFGIFALVCLAGAFVGAVIALSRPQELEQ